MNMEYGGEGQKFGRVVKWVANPSKIGYHMIGWVRNFVNSSYSVTLSDLISLPPLKNCLLLPRTTNRHFKNSTLVLSLTAKREFLKLAGKTRRRGG